MFDSEKYRARQPVDPPQQVTVKLLELFPPSRIGWGRDTPMWQRSKGIQVDQKVAATLTEWIWTSVGDRIGVCQMVVVVDGGEVQLKALVPMTAIELPVRSGQDG